MNSMNKDRFRIVFDGSAMTTGPLTAALAVLCGDEAGEAISEIYLTAIRGGKTVLEAAKPRGGTLSPDDVANVVSAAVPGGTLDVTLYGHPADLPESLAEVCALASGLPVVLRFGVVSDDMDDSPSIVVFRPDGTSVDGLEIVRLVLSRISGGDGDASLALSVVDMI